MTKTAVKTKGPTPAQRAAAALKAWSEGFGRAASTATGQAVSLDRVAALAQRQLALEAEVENLSEQLKRAQERLELVRTEDLPGAMDAAGISAFELGGGVKVKLVTEYFCSLAGQYREPAVAWLREQELDDLITNDVVASFGKGDEKRAQAAYKALSKRKGAMTKLVENVNTSSFKAVVREMLENGAYVPVDELGVTVRDAAKITVPKAKQEGLS